MDDLVQADKATTANKENILSVHLNMFGLGMFASALWGDVTNRSLKNLEKTLLNSFARDIPRDRGAVRLAPNLVDFIDIDDSKLSPLHVVIGVLQKTQDDRFHVFTHVAGFGERGGIGDGERYVQNSCKSAGEQCFT